tara:strand:- start:198 stop:641 length:444 start_codon:yes stop_codon:yes gene_type:complete
MATEKQKLGDFGEKFVKQNFPCPKCKNLKTLKQLPPNFKCADIICDFCGYLAQVKTKNVRDIDNIPTRVLGAAWKPQKERMDAGIYFPLFLVLKNNKEISVFYLSSDLQTEEMFIKRKKLSETAKRAGWQGYYFDGKLMKDLMTRLI